VCVSCVCVSHADASVRSRRKAKGGNGSKQFVEGWVEFGCKRRAKQVAAALNNTRMGGKKRDYYHDDVWNLKYLKNFK
jgi:ESF2/ABP1 family protein